jgi:hypothetical protein
MSTTEAQITSIAGLLSTLALTAESQAVDIYTQYTSVPDGSYPYLFISDGDEIWQDLDFETYKVPRQYKLSIVALFEPNQKSIRVAEAQLRELKDKVTALLTVRSSRNNGWQDLKLRSVSSPFNGVDVTMNDNTLIREIIVEIEDIESN